MHLEPVLVHEGRLADVADERHGDAVGQPQVVGVELDGEELRLTEVTYLRDAPRRHFRRFFSTSSTFNKGLIIFELNERCVIKTDERK